MDGDLRAYSTRDNVGAEERLEVALKASKGVRDLHGAGVIHCDLKPGNIIIQGNEVKVADLGLASEGPLAQGHWRGTRSYLPKGYESPDFVQDEKTDIYSLGVTIEKVCFANDPSASSRSWDVTARKQLEELIGEMTLGDATKRPDIGAVVSRLEAILPLLKREPLSDSSALEPPSGSSGPLNAEDSMESIFLTPPAELLTSPVSSNATDIPLLRIVQEV